MSVKVSIIMPVYNTELFLATTLKYVTDQSYTDYELICIDDGSDDKSACIVNQHAEKDRRIKYYRNEERKGAAFSRNRGLNLAHGEYVVFWDADDYFDPEILSILVRTACQSNTDLVLLDYKHVDTKKVGEICYKDYPETFIQRWCKTPIRVDELDAVDLLRVQTSPYNKIIRRGFLIDNGITFQDLPSSNDVFFSEMSMLLADKVIAVDTNRYLLQVRDHDSPSRISVFRDPMCEFIAREKIMKEMLKRGLMQKHYRYYFIRLYMILVSAIFRAGSDTEREKFRKFLKNDGIDRLIGPCKEYFDLVDDYTRSLIESFLNEEFSAKWFDEKYDLKYYFNTRVNSLSEWVKKCHADNKKIALWGIGERGRYVANKLFMNNIEVDYLLDRNKKLQGTKVGNLEVAYPDQALEQVDYAVFSSVNILDDNISELNKQSIKCIYLTEI